MQFEYDRSKSKTNKEKHGIDFEEGKEIWTSPVVEIRSKYDDEPRKLVIGHIKQKFWTAIITIRNGIIRIISIRRSREEEKKLYENIAKNNQRKS